MLLFVLILRPLVSPVRVFGQWEDSCYKSAYKPSGCNSDGNEGPVRIRCGSSNCYFDIRVYTIPPVVFEGLEVGDQQIIHQ